MTDYNLQWLALPHCPENQLQKDDPTAGCPTDAGYDLRVAEDCVIYPYRDLDYEVTFLCSEHEWQGPSAVVGTYLKDGTTHYGVHRRKYKIPLLKTGIKLIHPVEENNWLAWVALASRSSCGKMGFAQPHSFGIVDLSYTGEVLISAVSLTNEPIPIRRGEAIAQLVPMPQFRVNLTQVQEDPRTKQRGGFGSTSLAVGA